ncbi:uncharacterized protein LOC135108342 isoform X2 [Scylla paramamosain]|uniref:uncharacterized protein LOC135108342 isoform X2 n=1 Tax=Scylla paramamosain TaxID=85552 RepID=UPI0030827DDE
MTPQVALLLAVLLADIVLAMQLSSMCFGALLALCVVACCAYHICGPAEELDYGRYSSFKNDHPRLPPELLREIYTLPATTSLLQPESRPGSAVKQPATLPQPSPSIHASRPAEVAQVGTMSGFMEGRMRAASVGRDIRESLGGQRTALTGHLPNGRLRGPTTGETTPPLLRRPLTVQNTRADVCRPPRLLNLNCMVDGRPRLLTLSAMTSSRAAREVAGRGAANRLAAHDQTSSTSRSGPCRRCLHTLALPHPQIPSPSRTPPSSSGRSVGAPYGRRVASFTVTVRDDDGTPSGEVFGTSGGCGDGC